MIKSRIFIPILLLAVLPIGCKTTKQTLEKEVRETNSKTDSVSVLVDKTVKVVTTPQTTAKLTLSEEQLTNLPEGASYQAKDGNATGTVKKTAKGIEFTANCDSLNLLIEQLTKEVYRYKSDSTALVTKLNQQQTIEVNKLTSSQLFQIWGFRSLVVIAIVLTFKKFNIWQLIRKLMQKML